MRTRLPSLIALCLCGAFLAACASDPEASAEAMKATFAAGLKAYDSGDFTTAYRKWSSIDDVDLGAMRNVAIMLRTGKGMQKDPKAAMALMARAAQAGLFTAQADLGDMLLKGEAGPPDPMAAAPWLQLATMAGHPLAAYELGQLYEQGTAGEKDIEKARSLYKIAAAAGIADAAKSLAALPPETMADAPPGPPPSASPSPPPSTSPEPPPAVRH